MHENPGKETAFNSKWMWPFCFPLEAHSAEGSWAFLLLNPVWDVYMISVIFFYNPLLINWPKMSDVAKIKTHMCKLMFNLLLLKQFSDYFTF